MKKRLALAALTLALGGSVGYNFISEHEGRRLSSYRDAVGVWTICDGHTRTAKPGQTTTHAICDHLLKEDTVAAERAVHRLLPPDMLMTWEQYLALVDFVFNLGESAFAKSTLRQYILAGRCEAAGGQFLRWNKGRVNGELVELRGLTKRRKQEAELWLSGC